LRCNARRNALPNPVFVSVEEYLHSSYRPDCDYVDGEVEERNLGEIEHSQMQRFFTVLFAVNAKLWQAEVFPEYRVQVAPTRFRVPDITVVRKDTPRQNILRTPPLLIIEILSPEDTLTRLQQRVTDYLRFGVEHIWLIDPYTRRAYLADAHGFHEPQQPALSIPGTPIELPLATLWQELDDQPA
jgi:Uma2 family endonuclease